MTKTMDMLLPCPFCGSDALDQRPNDFLDATGANVVRCAWCHGAAPMRTWNRRAQPDPEGAGEVEAWERRLRGRAGPFTAREGERYVEADVALEAFRFALAAKPQGDGARVTEDAGVDAFLAEVRTELIRARAKFPGDRLMTIALAEEFGELCKAVLDEPSANVRKEAVQTAVMAARVALDGDSSVNEWRRERGLDALARVQGGAK
ncbi:hypothetical protein [Vulcaniibacterium tengchongense]|uniref:Restriction alleviation protein Lar n=1 Tax=Vulcaniibacterium tengchongense TaxID=1273429 RepID=A0A3N4VBZ5_9GAMM|nr:hypothetical protein [Vulcaniibacterium tengchongense]RPE74657.1 hypothetical protein EDC50_3186 [Vulcaniibacterium tengchongense]